MSKADRRYMRARAQRYRNLAADCRLMARSGNLEPDIQTSAANAASELETVASALLAAVEE